MFVSRATETQQLKKQRTETKQQQHQQQQPHQLLGEFIHPHWLVETSQSQSIPAPPPNTFTPDERAPIPVAAAGVATPSPHSSSENNNSANDDDDAATRERSDGAREAKGREKVAVVGLVNGETLRSSSGTYGVLSHITYMWMFPLAKHPFSCCVALTSGYYYSGQKDAPPRAHSFREGKANGQIVV